MNLDLNEVILQLIVMISIILVGYIAKRTKILDSDGDKTLSSLVVNITTPFLIIYSMTTMTEVRVLKNIFIVALIYTIIMLITYYVISKIVLFMRDLSLEEKTIYRFSVIFGNIAFIGFPMCYALFGNIGLLYASIASAVQDIFLWTLGVKLISGRKTKGKFSNLLNPNIIAIFIGIVFLILDLQLPAFAQKTFLTIGNTTSPLAFLVVGSGFYGATLQLKTVKRIILPTMIKLLVIPLFATLILINIPSTKQVIKYVILIELSMPCAASMAVMAKNYGRDHRLASQVVMFMIVASIITLPLMVLVIQKFI